MFTRHSAKRKLAQVAVQLALVGSVYHPGLYAANAESVAVEVEFVDPMSISTNNSLDYGLISTDMIATNTVVIGTNGAVTDTTSRVLGGTQEAAELTVTATASQALTVLVDNVSTPTGYTIGTFQCDYNAGATTGACDGGGLSVPTSAASAALLIGATITGNGSDVAGTDNATFDVTVSYQ